MRVDNLAEKLAEANRNNRIKKGKKNVVASGAYSFYGYYLHKNLEITLTQRE